MPETKPIACTLEPNQLAGRLDQIQALARSALIRRERGEGSLRLVYRREAEAAVRDLIRREQTCCAFLDFAMRFDGEHFVVEIRAPAGADAVLDAFG